MINILLNTKSEKRVILNVIGHTDRNICIAISALTNCIVQYAEDYQRENQCKLNSEYDRGNVSLNLEFENELAKAEFLKGIDAIINGFELYRSNFEDNIKINYIA